MSYKMATYEWMYVFEMLTFYTINFTKIYTNEYSTLGQLETLIKMQSIFVYRMNDITMQKHSYPANVNYMSNLYLKNSKQRSIYLIELCIVYQF